jgi:hypothetical protein
MEARPWHRKEVEADHTHPVSLESTQNIDQLFLGGALQ